MKTTINGKTTRAGIKFVAGIVSKRQSLPILGNVLLYANGCFQVTATDLDCTLTARLPGTTATEGKTTIPARTLVEAVTAGNDVELETSDKHVTTIRAGAAVRSICGLSPDEFPPEIVMPESAAKLTLPAELFMTCFKQVYLAMSTDESRYVLNGVCVEITAEQIQFIATDGRRLQTVSMATGGTPLTEAERAAIAAGEKVLSAATEELKAAQTRYDSALAANPSTYTAVEVPVYGTLYRREDHVTVRCSQTVLDNAQADVEAARKSLRNLNAGRSFIIPAGAVNQLLRMPIDKKNPGMLTLSDWTVGKENSVMVRVDCGDYSLTTKTIDGNYPNYKQVIPSETRIAVLTNIESFREALAIAEKATSEKANSVKLNFTKYNLEITANSPEVGDCKVNIACGYNETNPDASAKDFSIAFNPRYLIEACDSLDTAGDDFTLNFFDELSPVKITNRNGNMVVIMPMRLN